MWGAHPHQTPYSRLSNCHDHTDSGVAHPGWPPDVLSHSLLQCCGSPAPVWRMAPVQKGCTDIAAYRWRHWGSWGCGWTLAGHAHCCCCRCLLHQSWFLQTMCDVTETSHDITKYSVIYETCFDFLGLLQRHWKSTGETQLLKHCSYLSIDIQYILWNMCMISCELFYRGYVISSSGVTWCTYPYYWKLFTGNGTIVWLL